MSVSMIVPAYFYPGTSPHFWTCFVNAASRLGERLIVIANPGDGPGTVAQQIYTDAIERITSKGGQVIGYVYTCYAGRYSPSIPSNLCPQPNGYLNVDADINAWYTFYPSISGIFFDQVSADQRDVGFYQRRYDQVQQAHQIAHPDKTGLVVFNPGQNMHHNYYGISSALFVIFEEASVQFFAWQPATTLASNIRRSATLVYATPQAEYSAVLKRIQAQDFGGFFVTDGLLDPNPWNTLPPYFEDLVNAVDKC
jgi:Spherulation-specific family 4